MYSGYARRQAIVFELLLHGDAFGVEVDVSLVLTVRFRDRRHAGNTSGGRGSPGWSGWSKALACGRVMYSAVGMMRAKWPFIPPPKVEVMASAYLHTILGGGVGAWRRRACPRLG
jgi:hypothetical protein